MSLNPDILSEFPYTFDTFQNTSCLAIENGNHVLVTAHTSAGKSTIALYAIAKAIREDKKVIYTAPVKTLSNQKYAELKTKYGQTCVGIQTGDVKVNPDAQIVVMTTEILRNMLYKAHTTDSPFSDLAYVVFDEVHMINDSSRGAVWEEAIMRLPDHVQMIMLSATMANAADVAKWITTIKPGKSVPIISTLQRPVPLRFHVCVPNPATFSEDLPWEEALRQNHLKTVLESEHMPFDSTAYLTMQKNYAYAISRNWETKARDLTTGRAGVAEAHATRALSKTKQPFQMNGLLNSFINFLGINQQLPAIFFVLSRKKCDAYAKRITSTYVDHLERAEIESSFDYHVRKLPDAMQYEQVVNIKQLLLKGVGIHHSGMLPLLKEIVEVLFTKGLIKIMFATETLAIGVNTPTKLVCFVDVTKHNGKELRPLAVEEFKQMAGRAGRRGLDTVGHVVYFPLHEPVTCTEMSSMMTGAVKKITSKFNVSTHYVLRSIAAHGMDGCSVDTICAQTKNSLIQSEYNMQTHGCTYQLMEANGMLNKLHESINALDSDGTLQELINASATASSTASSSATHITTSKKARVNAMKQVQLKVDALSKGRRCDYDKVRTLLKNVTELRERIEYLTRTRNGLPTLLHEDLVRTIDFLEARGYVVSKCIDEATTNWTLTSSGIFANEISQCHELLLTAPLLAHRMPHMDAPTFAAWLAVYIDDSAVESDSLPVAPYTDLGKDVIESGMALFGQMESAGVYTGEFTLSLRYVDPVWEWCGGAHLQSVCQAYQLFEGNAIRSLLRLISLMEELRVAFTAIQWIEWTLLIDEAKELIVRDVLKTPSLYLVGA